MNRSVARHVIIVGGGASGVLLSYQLLQNQEPAFRVKLIERRPEIGRGPAYHTSNPDHVLNVRAANMSALPHDPGHSGVGFRTVPKARCVRIPIALCRGEPMATIWQA